MLQGGSEDSSAALECNLGVEFGVQKFCRGPSLKQVNLFKRFFVSRMPLRACTCRSVPVGCNAVPVASYTTAQLKSEDRRVMLASP